MKTPRLLGAVIALTIMLGVTLGMTLNQRNEIKKLNHACIATDTGGGVTQCLQPTIPETTPSIFEVAVRACFQNDAYIGATQEDTRHLFVQCLNDYMSMRGFTNKR